MDWFSKNNYRIVIRLPYSLQVLTVHSELYFLLFSFIHGGFSQPFGGPIRCSKFSFLPSLHLTGFLDYSCYILIDILTAWILDRLDMCSGKFVDIAAMPVFVAAAQPVHYSSEFPTFDAPVLFIEVGMLEWLAVTCLRCQTFGTSDEGDFVSTSVSFLINKLTFRKGVIEGAGLGNGGESRVPRYLSFHL